MDTYSCDERKTSVVLGDIGLDSSVLGSNILDRDLLGSTVLGSDNGVLGSDFLASDVLDAASDVDIVLSILLEVLQRLRWI